MSFGVTPTGFSRKPMTTIQSELEADWRAIFGANVDLSASTPDSQIIGIETGALDQVWQLGEALYQAMRPQQSVGSGLSDIVQFNGITRKGGSPSTVVIQISTTGGNVTLDNTFRIQSSSGDLWEPSFPGFYPDLSSVLFKTVETAPITVPASDSWTIVTPVSGLSGISNALSTFQIGTLTESDGALRARQIVSTENAAANILESLYGALLQVAGVKRVRIYVNDTNAIVLGRPAHSYEVVVEGGAALDVANTIWSRHPAGIELFGTTIQAITDSQGFAQSIKFTRPTAVPIFVDVAVSASPDYPSTGDADMAQAIVDYANGILVSGEGFDIGDDVRITRLYVPINSVPGHFVLTLKIDTVSPAVGTVDIPISQTQVSQFVIGNVTVSS